MRLFLTRRMKLVSQCLPKNFQGVVTSWLQVINKLGFYKNRRMVWQEFQPVRMGVRSCCEQRAGVPLLLPPSPRIALRLRDQMVNTSLHIALRLVNQLCKYCQVSKYSRKWNVHFLLFGYRYRFKGKSP